MSNSSACWYVVHTKPKQENRAVENLAAWGLETFAPKLKETCGNMPATSGFRIAPLFPQYVFARFNASELWAKVRFTHGVRGIVSCGNRPTSVDETVIALIRSRVRPDGFARIAPPQPGDLVKIIDGPFRSLVGVFERELSGSDRVCVLLTILGSSARLQVAKGTILRLPAASTATAAEVDQHRRR